MIDWKDFWLNYRNTTGELTWRLARGSDQSAIERLRLGSERLLGFPQRKVDLFERPVLLALVAENEDGKIVDLLYIEAQVEVVKIGSSSKGFEESERLTNDLSDWLSSIGYKAVVASCPPILKDSMRTVLQRSGFVLSNLLHWKRWL
jgi:hypothetical protein